MEITGIVKEKSYRFFPAVTTNGKQKKARCEFTCQTSDGAYKVVLFDKVAYQFNENPRLGEVKLSGNSKGSEFVSYQFAFTDSLSTLGEKNTNVDSVKVDKSQSNEALTHNEAPIQKTDAPEEFSNFEILSSTSSSDQADLKTNGDLAATAKEELNFNQVVIDSLNDDVGQFSQGIVSLFGSLGAAIGNKLSLLIKNLETGKSYCQELKVEAVDDFGIKGKNHKGEGVIIDITPPQPEGPHKGMRLLNNENNIPLRIVGMEVLSPGQKFYEQEIFYTKENGFLGIAQKEFKEKYLAELVRGNTVYGNWKRLISRLDKVVVHEY